MQSETSKVSLAYGLYKLTLLKFHLDLGRCLVEVVAVQVLINTLFPRCTHEVQVYWLNIFMAFSQF